MRFCKYSFRCTAVAQSKDVGAEEGGETYTAIGGGEHGEGEKGGQGVQGAQWEGMGEGTGGTAYSKWLCCWAGTC